MSEHPSAHVWVGSSVRTVPDDTVIHVIAIGDTYSGT